MLGLTWRCIKCDCWFTTLHSVKPVCCPYCKSEEIDTEYNLLCKKLNRISLYQEGDQNETKKSENNG